MEQPAQLKETVIRRMTRLAQARGAVNLAQGFTDETPTYDMVWSGVAALLGGTEEGARRVESLTVRDLLLATGNADADSLDRPVKELFRADARLARRAQPVLLSVRAPGPPARDRRLYAGVPRLPAGPRGADHGGARGKRGHGGRVPLAARTGRRRGGDAAVSRAVPVAGGDLRARAPLRDLARGSTRRNVAAGPRRAAGRPFRPVRQGGSRQHPPEPDRQGAGLRGSGAHRPTLPDARPVRDHRRDLRAHHLRRPSPPLPGALRGDGGAHAWW